MPSKEIMAFRPLDKDVNFLSLNQNICCGYSKEPSQLDSSLEHQKYMLKLIDRKYSQFSYFSTKTYVVGTQKNRFDETVLLSTKTYVKIDG